MKFTAAAANAPRLTNAESERLFNKFSLKAQVIPNEAIIMKNIASRIITF